MMVWVDFETFSEVDIRTVGGVAYARHPSTEVLIMTYALGDGPVQVWEPHRQSDMPDDIQDALLFGDGPIIAHNAQFDRSIMDHVVEQETTIDRWQCSLAKALTLSLPAALGELGAALGLPEDKQKIKDGRRLIQKFCKPRTPSKNNPATRWTPETAPDDWKAFIDYAVQDVETMRTLWNRMPDYNYKNGELALYHLDQQMNERGVPIDVDSVRAMIQSVEQVTKEINEEVKALTGGAVKTTSQVAASLEWLRNQDMHLDDLSKETVIECLESRQLLPVNVIRFLELRQQGSKSSTAKYKRMLKVVCDDHRVRGSIQYYGASRTGRFSGRLIQPQNFPRSSVNDVDTALNAAKLDLLPVLYDDPMQVTSSCLRSVIAAQPGHKLIVADLSNIEARVLPWLVGDEQTLDVFRSGGDVYIATAARIYRCDETDVNKDQRFVGKTATLALGYQGGYRAFMGMAKNYGVEMDEEFARDIVISWRETNPLIVKAWHKLNKAAIAAVKRRGSTQKLCKVAFRCVDDFLLVKLPSGRFLTYYKPQINIVDTPYGKREQLSFMGINQYTRKWERIPTYAGKIAENCTQAVARDVLVSSLQSLEMSGYRPILTVHDEVVCEPPDESDYSVHEVIDMMTANPPWADGLPLDADGYESQRYRK